VGHAGAALPAFAAPSPQRRHGSSHAQSAFPPTHAAERTGLASAQRSGRTSPGWTRRWRRRLPRRPPPPPAAATTTGATTPRRPEQPGLQAPSLTTAAARRWPLRPASPGCSTRAAFLPCHSLDLHSCCRRGAGLLPPASPSTRGGRRGEAAQRLASPRIASQGCVAANYSAAYGGAWGWGDEECYTSLPFLCQVKRRQPASGLQQDGPCRHVAGPVAARPGLRPAGPLLGLHPARAWN
jgi:hypothetical protein